MREVVLTDDFGVWVGEKRERIARLLRELARGFRRVDADGRDADAATLELGKVLLQTP
jgi:hypothetical protein